jgi:hypothetical protein
MSQEFKEQKFVFLCDPKLEQVKVDELNSQMFLLTFSEKSYTLTINEVLDRFQGVLLNVDDETHRSWFASQKGNIRGLQTVKKIYVARNGNKIDVGDIKKQMDVDNVIKNLPLDYKSPADFIKRIMNDHIGSINVGKLVRFGRWLKKKLSCC